MLNITQTLTDTELLRYSRQILLDGWDIDAQTRLKNSRIFIIGMGGLGCPVADTLVRAGVGELFIVDSDMIEASNLQRQSLFTPNDIGKPKVTTAQQRLNTVNELVNVTAIEQRFNAETLPSILTVIQNSLSKNNLNITSLPTENTKNPPIDLMLDCSDNFTTREFINQTSVQYNIPLLSASAIAQEGQLALFEPNLHTGCYHCLFPRPSDDGQTDEEERRCVNSGVLASTTAIMGNFQAQAALHFLGLGENSLTQTLLIWQGSRFNLRKIKYQSDKSCPVCGVTED